MSFLNFLQKKCELVKNVSKELNAINKNNPKTILFRWSTMMGKDSEEAKKLASRVPDNDGKWEGVKLAEKKECLRKVTEIFRKQ